MCNIAQNVKENVEIEIRINSIKSKIENKGALYPREEYKAALKLLEELEFKKKEIVAKCLRCKHEIILFHFVSQKLGGRKRLIGKCVVCGQIVAINEGDLVEYLENGIILATTNENKLSIHDVRRAIIEYYDSMKEDEKFSSEALFKYLQSKYNQFYTLRKY